MNNNDLEKAKKYAFLLLKFRPRSQKEIYSRLKKKKFAEAVISQTLSFLKEKGFLNDRLFSKSWIEFRIKNSYGFRKIEQELKLKGIDKETIDAEIGDIKQGYCEKDVIFGIAGERFRKLRGIETNKAKRRIFDYLMRRGFSTGMVIDAVNRLR